MKTINEIAAEIASEEKITQSFVRQALLDLCAKIAEIEKTASRGQVLGVSNARNLGAVSVLVEQVARGYGLSLMSEIEFNEEFEKRNLTKGVKQ